MTVRLTPRTSFRHATLCIATVIATCLAGAPVRAHADAVTETVMTNLGDFHSPALPGRGALTLGKDGNLYGTTERGGAYGMGSIYRVAPDGTATTLYSFTGGTDGGSPTWGLTRDAKGNFYGMTDSGGGRGNVFKITPAGAFSVLHSFPLSGAEGWAVNNTVTVGADGWLYGVTEEGGANNGGTFFRLATSGSGFTVLLHFAHTKLTASNPQAGLVQGPDGDFYGLSDGYLDENETGGYGAVYRLTPAGQLTTLAGFSNGNLEPPTGMPTLDSAGNLYFYGDVRAGGMTGRVYLLPAGSGALQTLHQFTISEGAPSPSASRLLLDAAGTLYGTASNGGAFDKGSLFSLAPDGRFAVLHNFSGAPDGQEPDAGLAVAADGSLWGTTYLGGNANAGRLGTVYRLNKPALKLSIKPKTIHVGQSALLKWSSTDTTGCTAGGGWSGALPGHGSVVVTPSAPGVITYALSCAGAGSTAKAVGLTVN